MLKHCLHLVWIILFLMPLSAFAQEDGGLVEVTAPLDGQPLFGLIEITGTAQHPSLFNGYALEWSNAQNPDVWLPIQQRVNQQVVNGILGQWDTVGGAVPDGVYQIRLRMFLADGTFRDVVVRGLVLANSAPTGIPTVAIFDATPTLPLLPASGESPTPLIQQPPTVIPRPTFAQPVLDSGASGGDALINFGAAQSAFCSGVFFSLLLFGVIIGYLALRSQLSPFTRRLWWQIRSELDERE